jgi:mono/diheme cytochrome c family protein
MYVRVVACVGVFAAALFWGVLRAQAAPLAQDAAAGETLFAQRCASCHTIGGGALVGPDLLGVTDLRDSAWLERWIVEPDKLLAANDPLAVELLREWNGVPMPNMGLTADQARDVIAYIAASSAAPAPAVPAPAPAPDAPAAPAPGGDPAIGRQLFTGQILLANNGSSCISCHNVSQVGVLGGGTLGPDLSHVATRYGEAGLSAALTGLPFPSMLGVFADRPLTPEEVEHLRAYLVQASATTPAQEPARYTFLWLAMGGAVVLLSLSHVLWINRQRGVRRRLLRDHSN